VEALVSVTGVRVEPDPGRGSRGEQGRRAGGVAVALEQRAAGQTAITDLVQ